MAALAYNERERVQLDRSQSCEIALDYVNRELAKATIPVAFPEAHFAPLTVDDIEWRRSQAKPQDRNSPDFRLALRQVELAKVSPVGTCKNIQELLDSKKIPRPSHSKLETWLKPYKINDRPYPWEIIAISMPAIDSDGKRAWFSASSAIGLTVGWSRDIEYRLIDGRWTMAREIGIGVS